MKYSKKEILAYIKACHRQRIHLDEFVEFDESTITFELSIHDWIVDMDLQGWNELCQYYSNLFEIESYEREFRNTMLPIKKKTIEDFCAFVALKAEKPRIEAIRLFGNNCKEAGIFKYLKSRLAKENPELAREIRPSSKLQDYLNDLIFPIITETNRINSNILPTIKYEPNPFELKFAKVLGVGIIVLILASFSDSYFFGGIGTGLLLAGVWFLRQSHKLPPKYLEFEGLETFRDLVMLIQERKTSEV